MKCLKTYVLRVESNVRSSCNVITTNVKDTKVTAEV